MNPLWGCSTDVEQPLFIYIIFLAWLFLFCYNSVMKVKSTELSAKTQNKIESREKKHKPKMRVSGKRVFQLKRIINSPRQGRGK